MVGGCGYSFGLFMVQLFHFRCLPVGFSLLSWAHSWGVRNSLTACD
jgi:hypothetical protein